MRTGVLVAAATLLGVAFVVVLRIPAMSDTAVLLLSNGGQLVAASLAAAGARWRPAYDGPAPPRVAVAELGTGAWAAGQLVWSYYEVVLGQEVPFPSLADVGFLLFPLAAAVGLVTWLGSQGSELVARGRDLLDGMIIAGSLLVLSWVTALGSVVAQGGDGWFSLTLSLAYPIGDLVLATLVLMALARGDAAERSTLAILTVGLGGLAFADSAYVYLVSLERYSSADTVSSGWVVGFLFVGVAGLTVRRGSAPPHRALDARRAAGRRRASTVRLLLPYLPLVAAATALVVSLLRAPTHPDHRRAARRRSRGAGADPAVPGDDGQPAAAGRSRRGPRPARAPGAARRTHRAGQPGAVRGPARPSAAAARGDGQRALLRPRRLQAGQRRARPRGR